MTAPFFSLSLSLSLLILFVLCSCRSWEWQVGTWRKTGLQHQHNPPQVALPPSPHLLPPVSVPTHHHLLVAGGQRRHCCCRRHVKSIRKMDTVFPKFMRLLTNLPHNWNWHSESAILAAIWHPPMLHSGVFMTWAVLADTQELVPAESSSFYYNPRAQQSKPNHRHGRKWGRRWRREVELLWNSLCGTEVPHSPRLGNKHR